MKTLRPETIREWTPHPQVAAKTAQQRNGRFLAAANGTRSCAGGWQFEYTGIRPGARVSISVDVEHAGVVPRDALLCTAHWSILAPNVCRNACQHWDYLVPQLVSEERVCFSRVVTTPADASGLTVRCTFRWASSGSSLWSTPRVRVLDGAPPEPRRVRIAVVSGNVRTRPPSPATLQGNTEYFRGLCERVCTEVRPQLIALPEIALQCGLKGHAVEWAVSVPGPETDVFAQIARRHRVRIVLPVHERDGDAVFNCAALISPKGRVDGRYHKVHLAVGGEAESGIQPGEGFPVFRTEIGRIGCNICMDSSATESSRMVGLNGADFLVLPIMGDHRADRWSAGNPFYNESRWLAIMRTRAMDNQLCMVVARNSGHGSCVINRKGDVLAWNEGDRDVVWAEVNLDEEFRVWNGGCFTDANWLQRRPHLYGAFTAPGNVGSLTSE
ncbi:MAG: hypothetical protein A3K19_15050 [Lentisphaerae bacterium RIFOXYB12_FULL_65_16]|nr:MAG: hypothetical protein A3K18_01630 [Lentisphaerae bacterium RIFOXYA12_64_32]OGV85951.1 MAG: hypothetical protein A3K19_15050 [Lentisphaerae bacterium RIFOXYB12_FULL_65_16]